MRPGYLSITVCRPVAAVLWCKDTKYFSGLHKHPPQSAKVHAKLIWTGRAKSGEEPRTNPKQTATTATQRWVCACTSSDAYVWIMGCSSYCAIKLRKCQTICSNSTNFCYLCIIPWRYTFKLLFTILWRQIPRHH